MKKISIYTLSLLMVIILGCENFFPEAPESNEVLAEPIESLTQEQLALHIEGDEEFARVFGAIDGLGPIFVQNSCESCHAGDGKGNPFNNLTRFGKYNSSGVWDPMLAQGGPQLQHRSITNYTPESVPEGAESTQFIAPNVTGLGYLAAVTDQTILAMTDPNDADGDGISGVVNYVEAFDGLPIDSRYHQIQPNGKFIGRFGRKASAINLVHQTVGAYKQDMGITSDFDTEDPVNMQSSIFADDNVPNPEIPAATVNKVVFYLQTLEAPRRRDESSAEITDGAALFNEIGCASCHKPKLMTGPSEVEALNEVEFYPYTDMLLHDMGSDLDDNYTEGEVETYEWRTMPLWGLGLQKDSQGGKMFLLHDGRASTYDEAVEFHGGEAASSRSKYRELTSGQKQQIVDFLNSL